MLTLSHYFPISKIVIGLLLSDTDSATVEIALVPVVYFPEYSAKIPPQYYLYLNLKNNNYKSLGGISLNNLKRS
jgi:hypothetical protein